jgi:hypothetical protein
MDLSNDKYLRLCGENWQMDAGVIANLAKAEGGIGRCGKEIDSQCRKS